MRMKKFILLLVPAAFITFLFSGCTKEVELTLPEVEQKIVVEGYIEPGQYPYVVLTKSAGYYAPIDSASLANYLVQGAFVTVSDGTTTDTLTPAIDFTLPVPIIYRGNSLVGQIGRTYTLTVVAEGKTLTSVTTINQPIALDSTWFKTESVSGSDSLGFVWAHLSDPGSQDNAYRWMAKRLHKDDRFLAPLGSTFDDKFVQGKSFDFAFNRGQEPGSSAPDDNNEQAGFFHTGDTIVVKFATIGRAEFDFFRTFETEVSNNGNPFAAPGRIKTNINGGLGIWCGYGAALDTVIAH